MPLRLDDKTLVADAIFGAYRTFGQEITPQDVMELLLMLDSYDCSKILEAIRQVKKEQTRLVPKYLFDILDAPTPVRYQQASEIRAMHEAEFEACKVSPEENARAFAAYKEKYRNGRQATV